MYKKLEEGKNRMAKNPGEGEKLYLAFLNFLGCTCITSYFNGNQSLLVCEEKIQIRKNPVVLI